MINNRIKFIYFFIAMFTFNLTILADVTVTGTTKTAYFSKIAGVHYQCNNGTLKTTGTDGSFTYDNTCSNIKFSLNNKVILGTISVANIPTDYKLYITDFVGNDRIDTNDKYVRNIAVLLQSLDIDEVPQNGINVTTSSITTPLNINKDTTITNLRNILLQQYPTRTLVSELCAVVHLEEVLKDAGHYVDTVPPCKPKLAFEVVASSNDKTYIELIGERNSSIYLNGSNTGLRLDTDGRYYDFELNTTIQRDTFDDFNITFTDATGKISDPLYLEIYNDTDQPFINLNTTYTVVSPAKTVAAFIITDDSIDNNIATSFEITGTHKDLFTITTANYTSGTLSFKDSSVAGTYQITVKVIDKANHYDIKDLNITVNP